MKTILSTKHLNVYYGDFQALFDTHIDIVQNDTIAVIGANGAGKSTMLKSIVGLLSTKGSIEFNGTAIHELPAHQIARMGIALVPEGRRLFASLSVQENLQMGAMYKQEGYWDLDKVYELFPILGEKKDLPSTSLSGGQQQMIAIGRALMSNPKLLLCDEISLGLAPIVIKDIYASLASIKEHGATIVVVEQDLQQALKISDYVYCLQEGRVSLSGKPNDLSLEQIKQAYFGRK